jgi:hypothetical protein
MKKIAALLLALVMCLSLVACGGPDKQPAVDAYNKLAQNYNTFVEQENENLDSWAEEDIEYMNQVADVITQYGEKLESDAEFAQEEIDEMVEMFNEFNATIEAYLNG